MAMHPHMFVTSVKQSVAATSQMTHLRALAAGGEYQYDRHTRTTLENSATGHIGFLELINATALPFARKRMQHQWQGHFSFNSIFT